MSNQAELQSDTGNVGQSPTVDQLILPGMVDFEFLDAKAQPVLQAACFAITKLHAMNVQARKLASPTPWEDLTYDKQVDINAGEPSYISADFALNGYVYARTLAETVRDPDFLKTAVFDLGKSRFTPESKRPLDFEQAELPGNISVYGEYVAQIMRSLSSVADVRLLQDMRFRNPGPKTHDFSQELAGEQWVHDLAPNLTFDARYVPSVKTDGGEGFSTDVNFEDRDEGQLMVTGSWHPGKTLYDPEESKWSLYRQVGRVSRIETIIQRRSLIKPEFQLYRTQEVIDLDTGARDLVIMGRNVTDLGEVQRIGEWRHLYQGEAETLGQILYPVNGLPQDPNTRVAVV
ncbi:MAG TPA: hypothetical protein VFC50_02580 [Candidatus Dormibacteraeota bacterium]|nr:hypothetical protein [Candidatus Dormibacteraeota bacterium]